MGAGGFIGLVVSQTICIAVDLTALPVAFTLISSSPVFIQQVLADLIILIRNVVG